MEYSFIDNENRDFLRNYNGEVIIINCSCIEDAEDWLLNHGEEYGWSNTGVKYLCWTEEFD